MSKLTTNYIGKVMATQNNRCTQFPLFIVVEDVERVVPEGCADGCHRIDEIDPSDLCEDCLEKYNADLDLPNSCELCDDSCFWWYKKEQEPNLLAGVFFTAEACEEHIKFNGYHYNNAKSYGISAWRNPEMQLVMQHLITKCAYEKLPSHYK